MDNASKALIMAGAVLIAVLLVSLGVVLLNSVKPMVSESEDKLDRKNVISYNSQYTIYEGTSWPASQVNKLIGLVLQNKNNANISDVYGEVKLNKPSKILPNKKYDITITAHDSRGVVSEITITEK